MMQRRPRRENKEHLAWIRERNCIICGTPYVVPAHIKFADARILKPLSSNIGMKADDRFVLALCHMHHEKQHSMGERKFWDKYHVDPILLALAFFSISGDDEEGDRLTTITNYTIQTACEVL